MPKPYKGDLSDTDKLVKWYLKAPLLPSPPFCLPGQPWIVITGDRFFEVLRLDCEKYLLEQKIHGQARFVGELQSMAMMSQELAQAKTEEVLEAA